MSEKQQKISTSSTSASSSRTSKRKNQPENINPIGDTEYNMLILQIKNGAPRTPDVLIQEQLPTHYTINQILGSYLDSRSTNLQFHFDLVDKIKEYLNVHSERVLYPVELVEWRKLKKVHPDIDFTTIYGGQQLLELFHKLPWIYMCERNFRKNPALQQFSQQKFVQVSGENLLKQDNLVELYKFLEDNICTYYVSA
ncbi:629_t:CDS:2 [Ambispora gerdemannii]|uniref:629_t:CDS:1 n=1 Tax=Ambispora gerdemannii TaxID=144530 RepID=A0A9N8Z5P5_9GLOM|nr:629_t:CDS:2 [Ambispora gerdemannii]